MGKSRSLTLDQRHRVLGMLEGRMSVTAATRLIRVHNSTVSRLRSWYKAIGSLKDRCRPGRPRKTSAAEDRYIVMMSCHAGTASCLREKLLISFGRLPEQGFLLKKFFGVCIEEGSGPEDLTSAFLLLDAIARIGWIRPEIIAVELNVSGTISSLPTNLVSLLISPMGERVCGGVQVNATMNRTSSKGTDMVVVVMGRHNA